MPVLPQNQLNSFPKVFRRADLKKFNLAPKNIIKETEKALEKNDKILRKQSNKALEDSISNISSKQGLKEFNGKGIIRTNWCGKEKCGRKMEDLTNLELIGSSIFTKKEGNCPICQKKTNQIAFLSQRYYAP
jgi:prolyl-tRNA synthetase